MIAYRTVACWALVLGVLVGLLGNATARRAMQTHAGLLFRNEWTVHRPDESGLVSVERIPDLELAQGDDTVEAVLYRLSHSPPTDTDLIRLTRFAVVRDHPALWAHVARHALTRSHQVPYVLPLVEVAAWGGIRREPDNAFFPWALAVVGLSKDDTGLMSAAIRQAARTQYFEDYAVEQAEANLRYVRTQRGVRSALVELPYDPAYITATHLASLNLLATSFGWSNESASDREAFRGLLAMIYQSGELPAYGVATGCAMRTLASVFDLTLSPEERAMVLFPRAFDLRLAHTAPVELGNEGRSALYRAAGLLGFLLIIVVMTLGWCAAHCTIARHVWTGMALTLSCVGWGFMAEVGLLFAVVALCATLLWDGIDRLARGLVLGIGVAALLMVGCFEPWALVTSWILLVAIAGRYLWIRWWMLLSAAGVLATFAVWYGGHLHGVPLVPTLLLSVAILIGSTTETHRVSPRSVMRAFAPWSLVATGALCACLFLEMRHDARLRSNLQQWIYEMPSLRRQAEALAQDQVQPIHGDSFAILW